MNIRNGYNVQLKDVFFFFIQKPEVIDDFVRNFLVKMGMTRTLDCFQNEW